MKIKELKELIKEFDDCEDFKVVVTYASETNGYYTYRAEPITITRKGKEVILTVIIERMGEV